MIDLPLLMFKKEQVLAEDRLALIDIFALANMTDEQQWQAAYERIREPLTRDEQDDNDQFDVEGFAALRARLTGG